MITNVTHFLTNMVHWNIIYIGLSSANDKKIDLAGIIGFLSHWGALELSLTHAIGRLDKTNSILPLFWRGSYDDADKAEYKQKQYPGHHGPELYNTLSRSPMSPTLTIPLSLIYIYICVCLCVCVCVYVCVCLWYLTSSSHYRN